MPPLPGGLEAVMSFTGHAVLAARMVRADFAGLALDGFGAALHPAVLLRLAGPRGAVGVVDATLVGRGLGGGRGAVSGAGGCCGPAPCRPRRR